MIEFCHNGGWDVPMATVKSAQEAYAYVESFLADGQYLVGDTMTVADLSVITTLTQLRKFIPIDGVKCPRTIAWIGRIERLPYFGEINTTMLNDSMAYVEKIRSKNKAIANAKNV